MKNPLHSVVKRAYRWGRTKPVLARRRGASWLLSPQNWIDNRILAGAEYEHKQIAYVRTALEQERIDTVIDIGANFGLYTVLAGISPSIENVWCFEPVRRNYAQLMANVYLNNLSSKVRAHNIALGDASGEATIFLNPRSTGTSRLSLEHTKSPDEFIERETVQVRTLDSICDLRGANIFMKVDVEGEAERVIDGAAKLLQNNAVVLQVEIAATERAVLQKLASWGYVEAHQIDADVYLKRASP